MECKTSKGVVWGPEGLLVSSGVANPGRFMTCIWAARGMRESIGCGRFMRAIEAVVVEENDISLESE